MVNKSVKIAKAFKEYFPEAQVIICRGGAKAFAARIEVVQADGRSDTHWFKCWGGFVNMIGQPIELLPILIEPIGPQTDRYIIRQPAISVTDIHPNLAGCFATMLGVSNAYLE